MSERVSGGTVVTRVVDNIGIRQARTKKGKVRRFIVLYDGRLIKNLRRCYRPQYGIWNRHWIAASLWVGVIPRGAGPLSRVLDLLMPPVFLHNWRGRFVVGEGRISSVYWWHLAPMLLRIGLNGGLSHTRTAVRRRMSMLLDRPDGR